nr:MAG TPA: hypothetical protein [Caudoviricetes sp.]
MPFKALPFFTVPKVYHRFYFFVNTFFSYFLKLL